MTGKSRQLRWGSCILPKQCFMYTAIKNRCKNSVETAPTHQFSPDLLNFDGVMLLANLEELTSLDSTSFFGNNKVKFYLANIVGKSSKDNVSTRCWESKTANLLGTNRIPQPSAGHISV